MEFRRAILDDTRAICELFCAKVERWQRLDDRGHVEDLPYSALSIYERWLHGGAWMTVETGAIWLSHLLKGAGLPYVLCAADGQVIAYSECFVSQEAPPMGRSLCIGSCVISPQAGADVADVLMQGIIDLATPHQRVSVTVSPFDETVMQFYQRYGLTTSAQFQNLIFSAQTGQGFYKAVEHPDPSATQIEGWYMPVGRLTSARQQWEMIWARHWDALPQITARKTHRLKFSASGQDALVCYQQMLYDPRTADVYCWTPKPFSPQLLIAIRDWGHRQGFRTLRFCVTDKTARLFGAEAEISPVELEVYARTV